MNLNKELPKGTVSLIISIVFFVIGLLLLIPGVTSMKTDDGSGLGNFLGQATIFVAIIAFLIAVAAFIVSRNARRA